MSTRKTNATTVLEYLRTGKSLTASQAAEMFGIKGFKRIITSLTEKVEAYGNWMIETHTRPRSNEIAYTLKRVVRNRRGEFVRLDNARSYSVGQTAR